MGIVPYRLVRYQETNGSHFVTISCYHRQRHFNDPAVRDLFVRCLEQTRVRWRLIVYGYVVMPEHVHVLVSEPERGLLADAIHALKLAVSKRVKPKDFEGPFRFWQTRYHDRNVGTYKEFITKLRYLHRNPVTRGLCESSEEWKWSSFVHYATGAEGVVEIESDWTARRREREVKVLQMEEKAPR